ncbi:MAG: family 16 glycoside hydrolase [Elusimicrobiota bacterium]
MSYRDEVWGRDGNTRWGNLLDASFDHLRKVSPGCKVDDSSFDVDKNGLYLFGDPAWKSYELKFGVQIVEGANAQIRLRLSESLKRWYTVDFLFGWQALGIARVDHEPNGKGHQKLSVVNLEMVRLREYKVEIAVRDLSITTYVDGKLINQATDETLTSGPMGFCAWEAVARFRQPQFRVLG